MTIYYFYFVKIETALLIYAKWQQEDKFYTKFKISSKEMLLLHKLILYTNILFWMYN
jgi:hypothetical protein